MTNRVSSVRRVRTPSPAGLGLEDFGLGLDTQALSVESGCWETENVKGFFFKNRTRTHPDSDLKKILDSDSASTKKKIGRGLE